MAMSKSSNSVIMPSTAQDKKDAEKKYEPNPAYLDGVPDMSMLIYLEEPNVIHNIRCRYNKDQIYTSISKILVALNPYKTIPIYGPEMISKYASLKISLHHKLPPHVYAVSEAAYRNLLEHKENQSMIVCGESGSGKTENAKLLMRHLAYTTQQAGHNQPDADSSPKLKRLGSFEHKRASMAMEPGSALIEQQILAANPILESFGNAKTNLNNNSSRFGKFTKLLFNHGRIVGSHIDTYLLEKSRVVLQSNGERNFHIFYQLVKGLPISKRTVMALTKCEDFAYLTQDDAIDIAGVSDRGRFAELTTALTMLGIDDEEQEWIFRMIAGILHLGNVKFIEDPSANAQIDTPMDTPSDTPIAADPVPRRSRRGRRSSVVDLPSMPGLNSLAMAASLFGLHTDALGHRLITKNLKVAKQVIAKPLSPEDATFNKDAIAKGLYSGLFQWMVGRINDVLYTAEDEEQCAALANLLWIGILDVFGFESFERNSFEQFCINFANERLQQFFNVHVIKSEQEEYTREAVFWEPIKVPDNNGVIDLIDKRPAGIRHLLDDACLRPKGSDEIFTSNLFSAHRKHRSLKQIRSKKVAGSKQRIKLNGFAVKHYAGEVVYDADGFLVKNADSTSPDTVDLFATSSDPLTAALLGPGQGSSKQPRPGRGKKDFRSVSQVFSQQLASLVKALKQTKPYFVRCINPNGEKAAGKFVDDYVAQQLRCGGLIEALRILKLGYPTRASYKQLFARFKTVIDSGRHFHERDFIEAILHAHELEPAHYQMGLTKVFFKSEKADAMEKILKAGTLSQDIMERIYKHMARKRMIRMKAFMKAYARWTVRLLRMRARRRFAKAAGVARILGSKLLPRCRAVRRKQAALTIQAAVRAYAKNKYLRRHVAAVTLQAAVRCGLKQKELQQWLDKLDAALYISEFIRKHTERKKLVKTIDERVAAKRSEREKEMQRLAQQKRKEEEERKKRELEERRLACKYFPTPASMPYDDALEPFVEEIAVWIAERNGESIEGDFFDASRNGVLLCSFANKLDASVKFNYNKKARPNTSFARSNVTKFLDAMVRMGVSAEVKFPALNLQKMKDVEGILNFLFNVAYLACELFGLPAPPTVEAYIEEHAEDDPPLGPTEVMESGGIVFIKGEAQRRKEEEEAKRRAEEEAKEQARLAEEKRKEEERQREEERRAEEERKRQEEERRRKEEEERVAAEKKRREEEEAAARKKQEEQELRQLKEAKKRAKAERKKARMQRMHSTVSSTEDSDTGMESMDYGGSGSESEISLAPTGLPRPRVRPKKQAAKRRASIRDPLAQMFVMAFATTIRKLSEEGVIKGDDWVGFQGAADLYKIVAEDNVPWPKWEQWIRDRVSTSIQISDMVGGAKSAVDCMLHLLHKQNRPAQQPQPPPPSANAPQYAQHPMMQVQQPMQPVQPVQPVQDARYPFPQQQPVMVGLQAMGHKRATSQFPQKRRVIPGGRPPPQHQKQPSSSWGRLFSFQIGSSSTPPRTRSGTEMPRPLVKGSSHAWLDPRGRSSTRLGPRPPPGAPPPSALRRPSSVPGSPQLSPRTEVTVTGMNDADADAASAATDATNGVPKKRSARANRSRRGTAVGPPPPPASGPSPSTSTSTSTSSAPSAASSTAPSGPPRGSLRQKLGPRPPGRHPPPRQPIGPPAPQPNGAPRGRAPLHRMNTWTQGQFEAAMAAQQRGMPGPQRAYQNRMAPPTGGLLRPAPSPQYPQGYDPNEQTSDDVCVIS